MKKKDIDKLFSKLELTVRSTGHHYGWLMIDDVKILRVHYSHGKGDIPGKVIHKIRGQLKLSETDFTNLVRCPLSRKEYLKILEEKGYLLPEK